MRAASLVPISGAESRGRQLVYDIEFIRHIDGKAEALALGMVRLIGEHLASVVTQAEDLFRKSDTVPRPDGFRIVESGVVVYEFAENPNN